MKIGVEDLAGNLPKALEAGGGGSPDWLTKMENIVKGINDMMGFYKEISGKPNPATGAESESPKMGFSEARAMKKAEMAGKAVAPPAAPNEFREILEGLVKAANSLESMGHGDKPVGEVLLSLPVTLSQTKNFLEKLYKSKYGG